MTTIDKTALQSLIADKALTIKGLERSAGLTEGTINDILRGKTVKPSYENVARIANALDCHPNAFTFNKFTFQGDLEPAIVQPLVMVGEVAAGIWREAMELPIADQEEVFAAPSAKYPGAGRFCLRVLGNSMNLKFPEGTVLVCIKYMDLGRNPLPGEFVIVQRVRPDGLTEATCKQYESDGNGGAWLWPRSDRPEHQTPISVSTSDVNEKLTIHALVDSAIINL